VLRYQQQTRELLVRRALGLLSVDDEGEIAELLDDIWRELSTDQRHQLERWLEGELQPAPDAEVEHDATEVEAEDITFAPRSSS
jgi:hypothetical protein